MKLLQRLALAAALALPLGLAAASSAAPARPADTADWRDVDPANLVLIDTRYGQIAIELEPDFAPAHVARVRALARAHFYDGLSFYRVIDGFVAQGGIGEGTAATKDHPKEARALTKWPPLKPEFDRSAAAISAPFTPLGSPDLFAPETGHVKGFPAGRDPKGGKAKDTREWIIHCPGTFAFARDNKRRHRDHRILHRHRRGAAPARPQSLRFRPRHSRHEICPEAASRRSRRIESGVIQDVAKRDKILSVRIAADLPKSERPHYQVMRTTSKAFAKWKAARINPAPGFYVRTPPKILDVCLAPVPARRVGAK